MGHRHFTISEDQRKEYASGILLDLLVNRGHRYSVVLEGADKDLESLFVYMMSKDYLNLDKKNYYTPTTQGIEKLDNLKKRYEEYLAHFDLFCAVDLEKGVFAFEKIFELDDQEWDQYINQERFVDLRIAVAWFKKINPADFVFLSFLKEGQFDVDKSNWQFDLLSGLIWEQIEEIIDTAIQIEELGYVTEEDEEISGMAVLEDVLKQGARLSEQLQAEEEHLRHESGEYPNDYYNDDHDSYGVTSYESYYDPFYISPIWFLF
ncbi:MAG: hypothetical protein GY866_16360 [Proteobacteria bacterium]|nr:hypothetical protein [Pseudomonadota bacterium]